MGSFLQILFHTVAFRNDLLRTKTLARPKMLLVENLQKLFCLMRYSSVRSHCSPAQVRACLPDFFRLGYEQHDTNELAKVLLDLIETQTKSPEEGENKENLTGKHFEGIINSVVKCGTCGTETTRKEPFVDLQVHFDEENRQANLPDSIEGMLQRSYANETLD